MRALAVVITIAACGSSPPPPSPQPAPPPLQPAGPTAADLQAQHDREHHDELAEAHRKLEAEQQDALAMTCAEVGPPAHDRCLPSCYPTEPPDARDGKKLAGNVEIEHSVCENPNGDVGAPVIADEFVRALRAVPYRQRFPKPHKKGSWQEAIESALVPRLRKGDAMVVIGLRRDITDPLTKATLHCATVAHYERAIRHPVDRCGGVGDLACEAGGNPTARAINVVHYRLAEAKRLLAANNQADCQKAALEAVAVARGLPRWRQYAKLNVHKWTDNLTYRTRFDGILDEDSLFAAVAKLGDDAQGVYASCGGGTAATTAEQEQSFHACW
ncbi:MAG TPA: hypothetical protein VH143_06995 [Kofleriaceae bacterium]|nr:hypothetical protein [Kofleriaceae bacterium]